MAGEDSSSSLVGWGPRRCQRVYPRSQGGRDGGAEKRKGDGAPPVRKPSAPGRTSPTGKTMLLSCGSHVTPTHGQRTLKIEKNNKRCGLNSWTRGGGTPLWSISISISEFLLFLEENKKEKNLDNLTFFFKEKL